MAGEFLSLQEVADELGKSTQTIRRMIKKGEIRAERIRTPQGFQYAIERGAFAGKSHSSPVNVMPHESIQASPAIHPIPEDEEALTSQTLTDQEDVLTSQNVQADSSAFLENDFYILEPSRSTHGGLSNGQLMELVHTHHKEKLMLITILERLQAELAEERRAQKKAPSRLRKLLDYFKHR